MFTVDLQKRLSEFRFRLLSTSTPKRVLDHDGWSFNNNQLRLSGVSAMVRAYGCRQWAADEEVAIAMVVDRVGVEGGATEWRRLRRRPDEPSSAKKSAKKSAKTYFCCCRSAILRFSCGTRPSKAATIEVLATTGLTNADSMLWENGNDDDDALWSGEEIYYRRGQPSMISKHRVGPFSDYCVKQSRQTSVDPRLSKVYSA